MKHLKEILKTNTAKITLAAILVLLGSYGLTHAGSLTPLATPAPTFYTFNDIYTRLTTNATSTEGNHSLSTSSAPVSSMHTLTDIYNAIPTIDPTKVLTGTTYLGVAGSASAGADINATGPFHDNGDGTVTDQNTGLVWQATTSPSEMTAASSTPYCQNDTPGLPGSGWRLPTLRELQTVDDFSMSQTALPNTISGYNDGYYSSTAVAGKEGSGAENWRMNFHQVDEGANTSFCYDYYGCTYFVRCVRG